LSANVVHALFTSVVFSDVRCVIAVVTSGVKRSILSLSTVLSSVQLNAWWPYSVRATAVNGMSLYKNFCCF